MSQKLFSALLTFPILASCSVSPTESGDAAASDPRVIMKSSALALSSEVAVDTILRGGKSVSLNYIAQILPPLDQKLEVPVQATAIDSNEEHLVVVVYNIAGEARGAHLDLFDFSNPEKPKTVSSTAVVNEDFSDVKFIEDGFAAVAGADDNGATLSIYDLRSSDQARLVSKLSLPGPVATSIAVKEEEILVTTGDPGGVYRIRMENPKSLAVYAKAAIKRATFGLFSDDGLALVLGNNEAPGISSFESPDQLTLVEKFESDLGEAPARAASNKSLLVTNARSGFLDSYAYKKGTLEKKDSIEIRGTGNGVALQESVAVLSQGEAGLMWADLRGVTVGEIEWPSLPSPMTPPPAFNEHAVVLGTVDFADDPGSANAAHIHRVKDRTFILMADGRGGLRWLESISRKKLRASKSYNPSTFYDDSQNILAAMEVKIPSIIPVKNGNAGNHAVRLQLDDVLCTYRGGSSQSHPVINSSEWTRGLNYRFVSCTNGMSAGDEIEVKHTVALSVLNGSSNAGTTTAEAEL